MGSQRVGHEWTLSTSLSESPYFKTGRLGGSSYLVRVGPPLLSTSFSHSSSDTLPQLCIPIGTAIETPQLMSTWLRFMSDRQDHIWSEGSADERGTPLHTPRFSLAQLCPFTSPCQSLGHIRLGEGSGILLQCSCLRDPMDGGTWWAAVHGAAKSRTRLSDFTFTFHFPALEKEMAPHSSVLAWRIPGTGEPGGLPSMGSHRVRHDWSDLAAAAYLTLFDPMDSSPPAPHQLLCPWSTQGQNPGVGIHFPLQGTFPNQGLNLGLLNCRQTTVWATEEAPFHPISF